ncbi:molybdenum cofactor biosynthesis enzyme [Candidatus Saccharibacteria bacterium]|nr:MAG: molybdenum cofactor biosynthesis enzyme [Candidatus Saccharibacteria bacterium]
MTCSFCHNEGTPVAAAYSSGDIMLPNPKYRGGRVSVFESHNGVDFIPGTMQPNQTFIETLEILTQMLDTKELHLTGGEPTLHRRLPELIDMATSHGLSVKLTSNGENSRVFRECAAAGLKKVNFSIFGTTPEELAEVQHEKYRDTKRAEKKIASLKESIDEALRYGIKVDANIVMPDYSHADRVFRIINDYDERVSVRILNDIDMGDSSYLAIYQLMADLNATPQELRVEAGSSNSRVAYKLPSGRTIFFKQIRRTTLPKTCGTCSMNNDKDCKEGFYGIRVYLDTDDNYRIGVCIQRMDLTTKIGDFIAGDLLNEINELRSNEQMRLHEQYNNRLTREERI